jgi:outer membrane protein assembly factor BamD
MRAMCLYMQLSSIGRESKAAEDAKFAFIELLNKFPNSIYHHDCLKKIRQLDNLMAAHEMHIGRFYQKHKGLLSAIGRYNFVGSHYGHTDYAPEAYYRIVECCKASGLAHEAESAHEVLARDFPNSKWHQKSKHLLNPSLKQQIL